MKIKDFIKALKQFDQDKDITFQIEECSRIPEIYKLHFDSRCKCIKEGQCYIEIELNYNFANIWSKQ